jgi:hypothetical protein
MSDPLAIIEHMNETSALNITHNRPDSSPARPEAAASSPSGPLDQDEQLEWLEQRICELAGHLAAGTCRFLQLVAEFDARRGWASWDLPSCAAWLAWKCQVAPGTAREQVRVARALGELPVITSEFSAGRMSYAKVRALTRIATAQTEADLAEITGPMTAAQCERFVTAHRKVSDAGELANRAARRVSIHMAEDGSVTISARLPPTDAAVVLQALRAAAGDCEHPHRPHQDTAEDVRPAAGGVPAGTRAADAAPGDPAQAGQGTAACRASLADALVEVAGAYLSGKIATAGNPDIYQVIVHVGPEALLGGPGPGEPHAARHDTPAETRGDPPADTAASPAGRPAGHPAHLRRCHLGDVPAVSPAAAQALACHATVSWMLHDHDGTRHFSLMPSAAARWSRIFLCSRVEMGLAPLATAWSRSP